MPPLNSSAESMEECDNIESSWTDDKILDINNIKESFRCQKCSYVLECPVQTFCGHRFCFACIKNKESPLFDSAESTSPHKNFMVCPVDGIATEFFHDKCFDRELKSLVVRCSGYKQGCLFTGHLISLKVHENHCSLVRKKRAIISCPFKDIGCVFKDTEDKVEEHINSNDKLHLLMCAKGFSSLLTIKNEMEQKLDAEVSKRKELELKVVNLSSHVVDLKRENSALKEGVRENQEALRVTKTLENRTKILEERTSSRPRDDSVTDSCSPKHNRKADAYSGERMSPALVAQKEAENMLKSFVLLTSLTRRVDEHDMKMDELSRTSFDGTYVWKISDYGKRHQNAVLGTATSISSPPFYTSKNGYRVCGRVYLNGDGIGKGSHLSVFLVLLRGDYDALLEWPFNKSVTFTLLSQTDKNHRSESFTPDRNSSSFQRPTHARNVASGIPMFISISDFQNEGFVKDNCVFIKITIAD